MTELLQDELSPVGEKLTLADLPEEFQTLGDIAHARSGDKGDSVNIGIIAREAKWYPLLQELITEEWMREAWGEFCEGDIHIYHLPGIKAVNCVLEKTLQGGGTVALRTDAQGKSMGQATLTLPLR